jgi:hypothetical protein
MERTDSLPRFRQPATGPVHRQINQSHPTSLKVHFNIILPSMIRPFVISSLQGFQLNSVDSLLSSHTCYMPRPSPLSWFGEYELWSFSLCNFLQILISRKRSRYSDWLGAGLPRVRSYSPGKVKNFLFSTSSRSALGSTQPPIQWVRGALSPGVKWPGREADHSSPSSAEVKKMWIYASTPPYVFIA